MKMMTPFNSEKMQSVATMSCHIFRSPFDASIKCFHFTIQSALPPPPKKTKNKKIANVWIGITI